MAVDQLEEIKNRINLVDFINEYVPLKRAGRNFKALCPFHSEKTPSFVVSPERQIWHCFGACNEGGDIFRFLMKREKIEFGEALRLLAKRAGVKLRRYQPTGAEKEKALLFEINHLASEFFHYLLLSHPAGKKGLGYILDRGISKNSLQEFKLGFAPSSWEALQKFLVGKKGYRPEDLEKAGLVIKRETRQSGGQAQNGSRFTIRSRYYDRFRNRLMFPLKDHRGNVCGFAGRTLGPKQTTAKYVNTPETLIYHKSDLLYGLFENKEAIKKADAVILVEGELDTISSSQAGVKNVVAIKGSALTASQVGLLSRFTQNLVFALDQDVAGDRAAHRGIEIADAAEMSMEVVEIQGGKDPDEVAQKDPKLWRRLVKGAIPVYDYFLNSAFSRFEGKTAEGKRKISQELLPLLTKIANEIVQAHYLGEMAKRLGVEEEVVIAQVAKAKTARESSPFRDEAAIPSTPKERVRREILEEHLLSLGFLSENWPSLLQEKVKKLVKTPAYQQILATLEKYLKRYQAINSQQLAKMLPAELKELFDHFYLLDLADLTTDVEKLEKEWQKTLTQLERVAVQEKLRTISEKIERLEKQGKLGQSDKKRLVQLYEKFRDFSALLARP